MPLSSTVPPESLAHDVELRAFARGHVERVRARTPQFEQVDEAAFVAVVLQHLRPLPRDRAWLRRRWAAGRGGSVWIENYGLHLPAPRGPA